MKNARRANFIAFFGYLFPVSDTMAVKCWRAAISVLTEEEIDGLSVALREAVISKARAKKTPLTKEAAE